jgi:hypothetical protein
LLLALVAAVVYAVFRARQRLLDQQMQERLADARFEAELVRSTTALPHGSMPPPELVLENISEAESIVHTGRAILERGPDPQVDDPCEGTIARLRHAGMLDQVEGYMDLNGDPKAAAIVRFRDKRRVLLVPYHETEVFTERNLKRFDAIVFVGRSGKAVMISPLETAIAESLSRFF